MVGEISDWGNVLGGKCPVGEVSVGQVSGRGSGQLGNCPVGEVAVGELSVGEMSVRIYPRGSVSRGTVQSGNCPTNYNDFHSITI